jgi:hypothetical protein
MDFVLDYISDNTYWTILLIIHGLLAVALLGALTHQTKSQYCGLTSVHNQRLESSRRAGYKRFH